MCNFICTFAGKLVKRTNIHLQKIQLWLTKFQKTALHAVHVKTNARWVQFQRVNTM